MSKAAKKYCRACLKEIRNRTAFTNLMQPPNPIVHLKAGVQAKSYLQCYYFCLQSNSTRFNIKYLPDHPYICGICMENLLKTVDFIVKSQKNEMLLKSWYDDNNKVSSRRPKNNVSTSLRMLLEDDITDDMQTDEVESRTNIIEKYADEPEILEEDLHGINIFEIERLSEVNNAPADHLVDDDIRRDTKEPEEENMEEHLEIDEGTNQTTEVLDEVILPMQTSVCKTEKIHRNVMFKTVHKKSFSLNFKCLLCKRTFTFQRQLYQHYDNDHDPKILAFPCDICQKRHVSHKALAFHKHSIHNSVEYKDCQVCGQVLLPAFFKAHKERHKTAVLVYECDECNRTFDTECTLEQHHKDVHDKSKVRFQFNFDRKTSRT